MNKTLALMVKEGNLKEVKKLFPKSNSKSRPGDWTADQATETVDRRGQNILHLAVEANQMEIVRFLIEGQSMSHSTPDRSGWSPLHIACAAGNLEMIEYLVLRVGVDVNLTSVDQSTPLHYFVRHVPPPPQPEASSYSTLRRHNVHDRSEARKSLFSLRRLRSEEELSGGNGGQSDAYFRVLGALLHQKGRESLINAKNKNGDTPLHIAATRGNPHVLAFLLQRNANINAVNNYGETALHMAVRAGMDQVVGLLLEAGIDTSTAAPNTGTARDIAVAQDAKHIVELLDARTAAAAASAAAATRHVVTTTPTATKGESGAPKAQEKGETGGTPRAEKEESVRVRNPTFSLTLPRNLHHKVGETSLNRYRRSSVVARRVVEQTPARRFVVLTTPDTHAARNLVRYSSSCLQHTRSTPKAPLFTRPSHNEDAAKPAPIEKCPVQPVNAAETPSAKKADSLSRLFAMMQPSSDKEKEGVTTDKPVLLPEPDLDQERFQARREELILRLRKRAFALSEMDIEMSRRASFRARSNTYFSRQRGDSIPAPTTRTPIPIPGAVMSPLNSPTQSTTPSTATADTRRKKLERPSSLQFNPKGSGSFIGLRGSLLSAPPSGFMSARLPSTPDDQSLSNSDPASSTFVGRRKRSASDLEKPTPQLFNRALIRSEESDDDEDDEGSDDEEEQSCEGRLYDETGDEDKGYISCMADAQRELAAYEQELKEGGGGEGKKEVLPLGLAERKGIKRLLERRSLDFSSSPRKSRSTEAVPIGAASQKSARNTDWSASFARVLDSLRCNDVEEDSEDMVIAYSSLVQLVTDFTSTVRQLAKAIILELSLPAAQKTIKPLPTCAPGTEEFVAQDIHFRVANNSANLFPSTEGASKAMGHDMQALMHMVMCVIEEKIPDIYFPLTCTLDFRGFRVYATSCLPGKGDVVHGSSGGGAEAVKWNRAVHKKLKQICRRLNLQPYTTGWAKFYTPTDLVATREWDGRLHLSNFGRLFPCEQPPPEVKGSHLTRLLRPEFVSKYPRALCSEAYKYAYALVPHSIGLTMLSLDPYPTHPPTLPNSSPAKAAAAGEHEEQINEATTYLKTVLVPDFAREMDGWDVSLYSSQFLTSTLHSRGINVRYLGLVRHHSTSVTWRWYLMIEMVSRTTKCLLRSAMRYQVRKRSTENTPGESQLVSSVVDILNLTLGVGEDAELFWKDDMQPLLESKFESCTTGVPSAFNLRQYVVIPHADVKGETDGRLWIYQHVNESVGLRWVKASKKLFQGNPRAFDADYPLDDADFFRLVDRIESTPLSLYAQGYLMYRKAVFKAEEKQDKEARHFYILAVDYFKRALRQGYGLANLYTLLADSHVALNQLEKADMYYESAVAVSKQDPQVLLKYAIFLEKCNLFERAEDTYLLALSKDRDPQPGILCTYADFLFTHLYAYVDAHHLYLAAIKTLNPLPSACNNYACMSLKMANELLISEQPGEGMKQKRQELVERARVYFELALRRDPKHPQHLRNFGLFLKQHFSNETTVCVSGRFLTADELMGRAGQEEKEREQRAKEGLP